MLPHKPVLTKTLKTKPNNNKHMAKRVFLTAGTLVFLAAGIAIIAYLVQADFFTSSDLFWIGATAGFAGCLFLVSVFSTAIFAVARGLSAKRRGLFASVMISSALITIVIYFIRGPFRLDSDVWWYGAIAGFLGCLATVFLALTVYTAYKTMHKTRQA